MESRQTLCPSASHCSRNRECSAPCRISPLPTWTQLGERGKQHHKSPHECGQLPRSEEAVRTLNNARELPRPCRHPTWGAHPGGDTTTHAAPAWLGDSGDPGCPSMDSQAQCTQYLLGFTEGCFLAWFKLV